jgi:hypothetical protein
VAFAALFLLGWLGEARADYVQITIDLAAKGNSNNQQNQPGMGMMGMPGGMSGGGMPGGMSGRGMPGGMSGRGMPGGMSGGGAGGGAGGGSGKPGMGGPGMPGGMSGGGMPGGMSGGGMAGMQGGMGMMGGRGGMMGMAGGGMGMMGGRGGAMGAMGGMGMAGGVGGRGQSPQVDEAEDITDLKLHVYIPVVKMKKKKYGQYYYQTPYGKTLLVNETVDIKVNKNLKQPTPEHRYFELEAYKNERKTEEEYIQLLEFSLGHFMLDEFDREMRGLRKLNPNHPVVLAYAKMNAEMGKQIADSGEADFWRNKLPGGGYKVRTTPHYTLLYKESDLPAHETSAIQWADQMEQQYRAFFYWFAFKRKPLPLPSSRLVALLIGKEEDFASLGKAFGGPPVVADGFLARRYNLAVFSATRLDPAYQAFVDAHKDLWTTTGWSMKQLLNGEGKPRKVDLQARGGQGGAGAVGGAGGMGAMGAMGGMGMMGGRGGAMGAMGGMGAMGAMGGMGMMGGRGGASSALQTYLDAQDRATQELKEAQTIALAKTAIEHDSMVAAVSYETTRQLVAATDLLPRNVEAPRWLLFGLGSFFQTPVGSWWSEVGMTSDMYFNGNNGYRRLANKGKLDRADPALELVITDGYFRAAIATNDPAAIQKARTMAWALTYFLMRERLDGVLAYCQELSKMPRDMELSAQALTACFARAFDLADTTRRGVINRSRFSSLASEWYGYMSRTSSENDNVLEQSDDEPKKGKRPGRSGQGGAGRGGYGPNT